jgi:hypothetical protein
MLDNSSGETFGDKPFFNTSVIKSNKIKEIKGYYSSKAELQGIVKSNNIYVYQFNQNGELTKEFRTQFGDTLVSQYGYDLNGNLIQIRKSDKYGFHSYHFGYDSLNRITSKEYRRDLNKSGDRINFQLDKSYHISGETYSYENTSIGLKKYYFNSTGKVYKTEFFYEDEDGYLLKNESNLKTGSGKSKTIYKYGDKGLISEKTVETYLMRKTTTKTTFEYDENQNVLAQHYYRNGEYITEFQIIYNSSTMLLSVILTKDVKTNHITILKLTDYTFYSDSIIAPVTNNKQINQLPSNR